MKLNLVLDKPLYYRGIVHYHSIDFASTPHLMSVGVSGSGKTFLNKLIIGRIGLKMPDSKVTILDLKADDYKFARGSKRLFEFDQVKNGLEQFYNEFLNRQQGRDPDRSFRLIVVEELGSLLAFYDKKDGEAIKAMFANLTFLGRAFNVHCHFSTQRPESSYFNSGVRDSISVVIALQNLSKEAKSMLFSGYQDEMTETHAQGCGYMLVNGAELHSIKVPQVGNVKKLEQYITAAVSR